MRADVQNDMNRSISLFYGEVWPLCQMHCGGGDVLQMEGRPDSELRTLFDMKAGIDAWQLHDDGMRGIASRIQVIKPGYRPYDSFTIRMNRDSGAMTEYEKRCIAISSGRWLYPHLSIQAYAAAWTGPLLSIGISRTADIIDFIKRGFHYLKRTSNAEFAVCKWDKMRSNGYAVRIIDEAEIKKVFPF